LEAAISAASRLAADCNYGGRLTDERDRRALSALLEDFCTPAILSPDYRARGLAEYGLPLDAQMQREYLHHIQSLPLEEPPELFGLHANASIAKNLREMKLMCGELHRLGEIEGLDQPAGTGAPISVGFASRSSAGSAVSKGPNLDESQVASACHEILSRLPSSPFDLDVVRARYPMARECSMNSVLAQELQRFNPLCQRIRTSLSNLLLTLRGELVASA
jgi:dynein heavy chain